MNRSLLAFLLFILSGFISPVTLATENECWSDKAGKVLIDVNGDGAVKGAWVMTSAALAGRLKASRETISLLLPAYDVLLANRLCNELGLNGSLGAVHVLLGGRERLLAQQQAPAWDWLVIPVERLATNILAGQVEGYFIGKDKSALGRGLERLPIRDPARVAAKILAKRTSDRIKPLVLFVRPEDQAAFLHFFSKNRVPGLYLSFDTAEHVRDVLNQVASISKDDTDKAGLYYCN
ncbi:hypothetical protein [Pseudomonas oryzihabitans]|uniref:hypothetical protein n=1 Tax=Pseudomonas oryzihabitans TaxID=47885 RepID=UPI0028632394|nr:hypothetical protein [Pseudomonas psychrotolerans]MDR6679152.1 hypothetical protein [Pseudomonas psychrotolerans]